MLLEKKRYKHLFLLFSVMLLLSTCDVNDENQLGAISGTVLPVEADPLIHLYSEADTLGTQPDEEGNFFIFGLKAGTYKVYFQPLNETFADTLIDGIVIFDGEQYDFGNDIILRNLAIEN